MTFFLQNIPFCIFTKFMIKPENIVKLVLDLEINIFN